MQLDVWEEEVLNKVRKKEIKVSGSLSQAPKDRKEARHKLALLMEDYCILFEDQVKIFHFHYILMALTKP